MRQSKLCRKGCCQPPYDVTPLETEMPLGVKGRRSYPLLRLGSYKPMVFRPWVVDRERKMNRYKENAGKVYLNIQKILPALELTGQWSIDIMQNGDEFWIIDMAKAENSTFYDSVPEKLRNKSNESWIPQLT